MMLSMSFFNGKEIKIHFFGLNEILGYTKSFNSNNYCRIGTSKKTECQKDSFEKNEKIRNKNTYAEECASIDNNTAVVENSIWNSIRDFHVTDNIACDIMHDIYLGVAEYNLSKTLNYFI